MARGRKGTGVEVRGARLRVRFTLDGKRCCEPLNLAPTPPNLRYAAQLVATIRVRIDAGTFNYGEFFPQSKRVAAASGDLSLAHYGEIWLKSKGRLASATKSQYSNALKFWYEQLGPATDVKALTHGTLAALIGAHPWASNKLHNNYMIVLRGLFALAVRDLAIADPTAGIDNAKVQKKRPDPFTLEESRAIVADMRHHYDPRIAAYFDFLFSTGMRPEEAIALRWDDIDSRHDVVRVERARSFRGQIKPIKTYQERDVDLLNRASAALSTMKPYTLMKGHGFVFENPVTGQPWHDERSQREHYWVPCLKRLGIRRRRAYNTRHTYATLALMAGANPAYIARQLGHKNAKMVFEVYAKWIDGADRGRERAKVEAALRGEFGPDSEGETSGNWPGIGTTENVRQKNQEVIGRRDWTRTTPKLPHQRGKSK